MMEHVVRDLAHQMSAFIVRKRIQADRDVRSDSMTYRMDVYVLTPEELAALVDERAKQLLSSPGAFFHREQDHIR